MARPIRTFHMEVGGRYFLLQVAMFLLCSQFPLETVQAKAAPRDAAPPAASGPAPRPGSEVRELAEGVRVIVAPGAMVSKAGSKRLPPGGGSRYGMRASILELKDGRIDVLIRESAVGKHAVVVKGPRWTATVTRRGHSAMVVGGGRVAAAAYVGSITATVGPTWTTLAEGKRWFVDARFPRGRSFPLMTAPTVSLRAPVHVATPGAAGRFRVVVKSSMPSAGAYVAAIPTADVEGKPWRFDSDDKYVSLGGLAPGSYHLEARAVDGFGLEGASAPPINLRVLGIKLPPGAYFLNGTPYLRGKQQLQLTHAEGLEYTYGRGDYFIPVPGSFGLRRGRPVLIRLRVPGSNDETELRIEPRELESTVEIQPSNAVWPRDKVRVRVDVSELTGGVSDWNPLNVGLLVTLNAERIDPEWTCKQSACNTVVPPSYKPGPWVLRVELLDDEGTVVGRNFMEIADQRRD